MTEEWRPVPDFDGYEVSNLGRVRCWRARGYAPAPEHPRIVKPKLGTNGYLCVILGFKGPTKAIHRLVAEEFVDGQVPGLEVAHDNGLKHDNRATNLVWKTRSENMRDKLRHGTNGRTLTSHAVEAIRRAYIPGEVTQSEVAARFGTTQATVSKIVRGQIWSEAA